MAWKTSCHCGAVVAAIEAELTDGMTCNCSHCSRKGYVLAFIARDKLTLASGADKLATYTFNKHVIQHHFCSICGCAPFGEGKGPGGTEMAAVNLRCVEGLDLKTIKITEVDGASR